MVYTGYYNYGLLFIWFNLGTESELHVERVLVQKPLECEQYDFQSNLRVKGESSNTMGLVYTTKTVR